MRAWEAKWIPRPMSFEIITPMKPEFQLIRLADLIDHANGNWREDMIDSIFLPTGAKIIKAIPLCNSSPQDRVVWHYSNDGN